MDYFSHFAILIMSLFDRRNSTAFGLKFVQTELLLP